MPRSVEQAQVSRKPKPSLAGDLSSRSPSRAYRLRLFVNASSAFDQVSSVLQYSVGRPIYYAIPEPDLTWPGESYDLMGDFVDVSTGSSRRVDTTYSRMELSIYQPTTLSCVRPWLWY